MGTRGAIGVVSGKKLYATYNHWDSYPTELGTAMVSFCQGLSKELLVVLKERFKHIKVVDEQDDQPTPEDQQRYIDAGFYQQNVGGQSPADWYCLLRSLQGMAYIQAVLDGECEHWIDSSDFLKSSLFCEYAYIIDLDNEELWFFKGFNKTPDTESPLPFEQTPDEMGDNKYYPVKFQGKAPLSDIPEDWIKQFYPEKVEEEAAT